MAHTTIVKSVTKANQSQYCILLECCGAFLYPLTLAASVMGNDTSRENAIAAATTQAQTGCQHEKDADAAMQALINDSGT